MGISVAMKDMDSDRWIRPAAVAGRFYPSDPVELRETVETMLRSAGSAKCHDPQALIAPHAGYIYSGPVAASAYVCWKGLAAPPKRVVLIGPAHFLEVRGVAASSASGFKTPLGTVPVDRESVENLVAQGLVAISDEAHLREHSLEVQLPFLQIVVPGFRIIPLLAGQVDKDTIARVIKQLWNEETRFVISSDLTHYSDYATTQRMDRQTADAIEALEPEKIRPEQACGRESICGLVEAARAARLTSGTLDLRSSGDTAGSRDQVVGYGAFAFYR